MTSLAATPKLTVAGAALLVAARCSGIDMFGPADADAMLPARLRYTQLGPDAAAVTPRQAWNELVAAGKVIGDFTSWRLVDLDKNGHPYV
ncbi:hypothetical protein [Prescottella subtropica]|uniref:hypothetical protein n=1 Tax=Prescottella subtropica TaxID=2545757 RepID=UPI0010F7AD2D|nr:hypothetical protein [Prescottella subtropica]